MRVRMTLLAASGLVALLALPEAAFAQKKRGAFVADNVLWLPEVFAQLSAANKQSVQNEQRAEAAIYKKIERALARNDFSGLTRAELGRILSLSNLAVDDRDLTPGDLEGTGPYAYAGLDRMVGVGVEDNATSFRVDLSRNLLPTMLVPTVDGGDIVDYTSLHEVYTIGRVLKGKGGAKLAKNGIVFNSTTGELTVTLKKPFTDKKFVNLVLELDDGSSPVKGKKRSRASAPTIQVTFANMTNPLADEPIAITGSVSGGVWTSNALDIESKVTFDRPKNKAFVAAVENASEINLSTGAITDNDDSFTAVVTNGVLFKKFEVQVASAA